MNHKNEKHNMHETLRDKIMGQIKTEHISMRPRLYFTLQLAAIAAVSVLVLLLSVFIFNFLLFSIRINSHEAFLSFGPRGIVAFLMFFPWGLLIFDAALIFLLEWLLRTFKFGYRFPLLYVLATLLAITVVTGFALDRGTGFNDRLIDREEGGRHLLPPFNMLYGQARRPPHDGICRCTILQINEGSLVVKDNHRGATTTLQVLLPANDPRATTTDLRVGDVVMVAGDREGDVIRAFGVHKEGEGRLQPLPAGTDQVNVR